MPHQFQGHANHPAVAYLVQLHADLGGRIQADKTAAAHVRAALKASLVADAFLESELERLAAAVSFGFSWGKSPARRAREKLDDWREISDGDPPKKD
jgi:hypothetical protein